MPASTNILYEIEQNEMKGEASVESYCLQMALYLQKGNFKKSNFKPLFLSNYGFLHGVEESRNEGSIVPVIDRISLMNSVDQLLRIEQFFFNSTNVVMYDVFIPLDDSINARLLLKRIPSDMKNHSELKALAEIAQLLFKRDYPGIYVAINRFEWSETIKPLMEQFGMELRQRFILIQICICRIISLVFSCHLLSHISITNLNQ